MRFLCDVHISYKLSKYLASAGFDCMHVNQMLEKWHTSDADICAYADANDRIVVTKDEDFRDSYFLKHSPRKVIRVVLGNISNEQLTQLFQYHLPALQALSNHASFYVELGESLILYP